LLAQGFTHRLEQMTLAGPGLSPEIGGHRRARLLQLAIAHPVTQVIDQRSIGADEETRERRAGRHADIQSQLLHLRHTRSAPFPGHSTAHAAKSGRRFISINGGRYKGPDAHLDQALQYALA